MSIADNVKVICKAKNITINDLANKMGLMQPAISRMLHNDNISLSRLREIATILQCDISQLINELPPAKDSIICPHCGKQIKIKIDVK